MSLLKEALTTAGISKEEFQTAVATTPLVEETVVNPVDAPSSAVPVPVEEVPESVPLAIDEVVNEHPDVQQADAIIEQHKAIQEKADQLLSIQATTEQYAGILREAGLKGITPQTARVIHASLRGMAVQVGLTPKTVAVESFNASTLREQHELATISLEDIKDTAAAALNKFIEVITRVLQAIKKAGYMVYDGILKAQGEVDKLEKRLASIKGSEGVGTEFELKGAGILTYRGEIQTKVVDDIPGLAHFITQSYPEGLVKFFTDMTKGVLTFDAADADNEKVKLFIAKYTKPLAYLIENGFDKDELPGGYKLDVNSSGLSVGLKKEGEVIDQATLTTRSISDLRRSARDLKPILAQLTDVRAESEKIEKAGTKLLEAAKRVADKNKGNESVSKELLSEVAQIVQSAAPRTVEFIDYLKRYVYAQVAVINKEASILEAAQSKKA